MPSADCTTCVWRTRVGCYLFHINTNPLTLNPEKLEEIYPEGHRYLHQAVGIYAAPCKDMVDVGAVAVDLAGQPGRSALLPPELGLYDFAYVDCIHFPSVYLVITDG